MGIEHEDARFEVDASVIFQLGEHLITDEVQALVELVKNCYDADASYAKIIVNTSRGASDSGFPNTRGHITIEDDGIGMTRTVIHDSWLTLSYSQKREQKRQKGVTHRGRTPLGEKGLGRLGVQRLGDKIEIRTRPRISDEPEVWSDTEVRVAYAWSSFVSAKRLSDVVVNIDLVEPPTQLQGTRLIISDLKSPEVWSEKNAADRLTEGLSQMLSPYEEAREFDVYLTINGRSIDLGGEIAEVRQAAQLHYELDFDRTALSVVGVAKLVYFRPGAGDQRRDFDREVRRDGCEEFRRFLIQKSSRQRIDVTVSSDPKWFVEFRTQIPLTEVPNVRIALDTEREASEIGPFHGQVDAFDFDQAAIDAQDVFDNTGAFANYIRSLSGIRVFRDGFGVRVDRDWLRLGEQYQNKSVYGLRPANTLGFIAISARDNPLLLEKTDREGFLRTPSYENFELILKEWVNYSTTVQGFMRRTWTQYWKGTLAKRAGRETTSSPKEITAAITGNLQKTDSHRKTVTSAAIAMRSSLERLEADAAILSKLLASADQQTADSVATLLGDIQQLRESAMSLDAAIEGLASYFLDASLLTPAAQLLGIQVAELQQRLGQLHETVSLGLTAEYLTHEIANVADHLAERTRQVTEHVKKVALRDVPLVSYLGFVRSVVAGLRKQLAHLTPALRFARERRDVLSVSEFLAELASYYTDRWKGEQIVVTFVNKSGDTSVRINRGKLTQVFDNLLINSHYWVGHDSRRAANEDANITIALDGPLVQVFDSGPGVSKRYEGTLFEPFVTGRGTEGGRGLGLYIVSQMLALEGCTISLLEDRNELGNRFIFQINLEGVVHDGKIKSP